MQHFSRFSGLFLTLSFSFTFLACTPSEPDVLSYTIRKSEVDGQPALAVTLQFSPDSDGRTEILFSDQAWGEENLFDVLKHPKLVIGEGELRVVRDSGRIEITHPADKALKSLQLEYHIIQDTPLGAEAGDPTYRPIVQPEYFHVFGHNFLALPEHLASDPETLLDIDLHWEGWAPDEVIHNSFGSRERDQELRGISVASFHSSVFVGGDYRIYEESVEGNRLLLAIRGDWIPFNDKQVFDLLGETIRAQRDFWNDHSQEYFTVTLRPYDQDKGSSYQGTGLTNSFATSMSNNTNTEFDQLVHLFNHELMHNWIGHTIENESEEAQYWFSEGFTEYYTIKNIASHGIAGHGWDYYIRQVNDKIRLLESLSIREAPNSEITYENFWKDREYSDLPYHRGFLYAFYLDQYLQKQSGGTKSLDDLMRELLRLAEEEKQKLNHPNFLEALHSISGENPEPFFYTHIIEGQPLPLTELFESLGMEYTSEGAVFELGFRLDRERRLALEVDPESQAYSAGLREGDQLRSHSIYFGNTNKAVELTVVREGKSIPLSYYPVRSVDIPQLSESPKNETFLRK